MMTLSLRTRLFSGFGVMAVLIVGFAAYTLRQEEQMRGRVEYLLGAQAEVHIRLQDLREALNAMQRNAFQGALNHDRKLLLYATAEAAQLFEVFEELREDTAHGLVPDDRARLSAFLDHTEDLYREIMARSFVTLADLVEGGRPDAQRMARLRLDNVQLNSAFAVYLTEMRGEQAIRLQEVNDGVERLRTISTSIAAVALLAMVAYLLLMRRYLTGPLRRLDQFVAGISEPAEVSVRAPVLRYDEIGSIAMALNRMLDGLQETVISRNHYDHVLANLSNALIVTDRRGMVETVNAAACRALGCSADTMTGQPATRILPDALCARLSGGGGFRDMEIELLDPAGKATPVLVSAERLPKEEGGWVIVATDITERRKVEEALRRSEERYRQVIENVSEGILVAQDARVVYVNPSLQHLIGYAEHELLHKEFLPFVHPEDRPKVLDRYSRRLRGEPVERRYDCRVIHKSGDAVWVDLSAVVIQWEGKPATLSFVSDITERKRFEDELRIIKERYDFATAVGKVGTWDWSPVTGILYWSDETFRLMGYAPGSVTPTYELYLGLVHPDDREMLNAAVMAALNERTPYDLDCRIVLSDGTPLVCHVTGKVEFSPDGQPLRMLGTIQDVTIRKRFEDELRITKERYDIATAVGKVGTWDWSPVTGILYWSDETFRLMGYAPGSVTPTYELYLGLVHPDDREMLNAAVMAALNERTPYDLDCRIVLSDGTPLVCHVTGKVEFSPDGQPLRMLGTIQDVTARKQAEQEIQLALEKQKELNYLKSRFVSMTSHEFRTPLAAILSSSELLRDYSDRLPSSEKRELFGSITGSVERMTQMLEDILIIGKAEAGHLEFRPEVVPLRQLCETLVSESRVVSEGRGTAQHEIDFQVDGECEAAELDEKLLRHIVGNLLSNAVKYSPQGGRIAFIIKRRGNEVELTVRDQGIGMPEEDLPRLFETFFRARNVGNISGTGLGLAIVKHAVDLHGGRIHVDSRLGQGTTFIVTLPCGEGKSGQNPDR